MNIYHIFSGLAMATTLVVTISLFNAPATANDIQQIVNSGIYPREPNFFSEGRKQFERELQLLLNKKDSSPEAILKINSEPENIQPELTPLEKPASSQDLPSQE